MDFDTLSLLIPLLAILMGGLVVLIPILGLTARFALKPAVEAYARLRTAEGRGQEQVLEVMEQRMALLERQMEAMESTLRSLEDGSNFDRQLAAPRQAPQGTSAKVPLFEDRS